MQAFWLALELRRWRKAGHRPRLWWRDDDARDDTPALRRLLALSAASGAPLTVAAIPDGDRSALGAALAEARAVSLVQHGVDHQNRADEGGSREFADEADAAAIGKALSEGWSRLADLPGAVKVFVPPWNAIHAHLGEALLSQAYEGWSAWAVTRPRGAPPRVDTHLDVLRWKGGGRFRGAARIQDRLRRLLAERRLAGDWSAPVGLLTHHLDHDEATWRFLEKLLARRDVDWLALPALLAEAA